MQNQANSGRIDIQFVQGDWVLLKLQPYRQSSLVRRSSHKLSRRFYGPFQIINRVGAVAYRLKLPDTAKLHNIFHVSKLKTFVGDPPSTLTPLEEEFLCQHPLLKPKAILKHRSVLKNGHEYPELLIQWNHQLPEDATWENAAAFKVIFPNFILEDKELTKEGAIVA